MKEHVAYYFQVVEKAIAAIGPDPVKTRKEKGRWTLIADGVPVWIHITYQAAEKRNYFLVTAPIMKMPEEARGEFCEQLLRLNGELFGAAFMEKGGHLYISNIREVEALNVTEAHATIKRIGNYASYYVRSEKKGILNWTPYRVA